MWPSEFAACVDGVGVVVVVVVVVVVGAGVDGAGVVGCSSPEFSFDLRGGIQVIRIRAIANRVIAWRQYGVKALAHQGYSNFKLYSILIVLKLLKLYTILIEIYFFNICIIYLNVN